MFLSLGWEIRGCKEQAWGPEELSAMEMAPSLALTLRGAGAGLWAREGRCSTRVPWGKPGWDREQWDGHLLLLPAAQRSLQTRTETPRGVPGIQFTFPGVWQGDESQKSFFFPLLEHNFPQQSPLLFYPPPSRASFSQRLRADTRCLRGAGLRDVSPGMPGLVGEGAQGSIRSPALVHHQLRREQGPSP